MNDMTPIRPDLAAVVEQVIIRGDLSHLSPKERTDYYVRVCDSVGLNPLTKPFDFIVLNGKCVLYALKSATDQLRAIHKVSVIDMTESDWNGMYVVTTKVQNADGRTDIAKAALMIGNLQGDALCNAIMKCETKSKRRATLSICGLGFLSEDELETTPASAKQIASEQNAEPLPPPHLRARGTFDEVATEEMALPKKDTKQTYAHLQAEIDGAKSREWLREWREANTDRIAKLQKDWRDMLFERYQEQMKFLKEQEAVAAPAGHRDEVIWQDEPEPPKMAPRPSYPSVSQRLPSQNHMDFRWSRGAA